MNTMVRDIVTLDFHEKKRMGIILQIGAVPGSAIVAIGYGVQQRHSDRVRVTPHSQWGQILRIYKDTAFYARRTYSISLNAIYPTGRICPRILFERLEPFVGDAIINDYNEIQQPRKSLSFSSNFSVTLGELANS